MTDEERLQKEDEKVLEVLKEEFSNADDWNVNDNDECEVLDKEGNIICRISTDRLTKIYNSIEL